MKYQIARSIFLLLLNSLKKKLRVSLKAVSKNMKKLQSSCRISLVGKHQWELQWLFNNFGTSPSINTGSISKVFNFLMNTLK